MINSLFSGLAFAGVIIAIYLQKLELQEQRQELMLTRDELHGQREQMELQNENLITQRFENTFFELLKIYIDNVNKISIYSEGREVNGRNVFTNLNNRIKIHIITVNLNNTIQLGDIKDAFNQIFTIYATKLDDYLNSLFNILDYLNSVKISNKDIYLKLLGNYLSNDECNFLQYHVLTLADQDQTILFNFLKKLHVKHPYEEIMFEMNPKT